MKRILPKEVGDKITGRANSKGVTIQNRHYIIGGFSQTNLETSIASFVITNRNPYTIQWRQEDIKNIEMFTPRHSFAVTALENIIYIYGGDTVQSKSFDQLFAIDVVKKQMTQIKAQGQKPLPLNSITLTSNALNNQLILFGGTSEKLDQIQKSLIKFYKLNLQTLIWRRVSLTLQCYQHGIWQHTCHLIQKPLTFTDIQKKSVKSNQKKIIGLLNIEGQQNQQKNITQKISKVNIGEDEKIQIQSQDLKIQLEKYYSQGPLLLIVGGCSNPHHPYSQITQLDIQTGRIIDQTFYNPIVSHQSVLFNNSLFIFGGTDGSEPTSGISIINDSSIKQQKGFVGVGPVGFASQKQVIIFGGINTLTTPPTFNGPVILYE